MTNNIKNLNLMDWIIVKSIFRGTEKILMGCPHCGMLIPEDLAIKENLGHSLLDGSDYEVYKIKCTNIECKKEYLYYV